MMLVLYFKNDKASFQEPRFTWEVISSKHLDWSKAQIVNISEKEANFFFKSGILWCISIGICKKKHWMILMGSYHCIISLLHTHIYGGILTKLHNCKIAYFKQCMSCHACIVAYPPTCTLAYLCLHVLAYLHIAKLYIYIFVHMHTCILAYLHFGYPFCAPASFPKCT